MNSNNSTPIDNIYQSMNQPVPYISTHLREFHGARIPGHMLCPVTNSAFTQTLAPLIWRPLNAETRVLSPILYLFDYPRIVFDFLKCGGA